MIRQLSSIKRRLLGSLSLLILLMQNFGGFNYIIGNNKVNILCSLARYT